MEEQEKIRKTYRIIYKERFYYVKAGEYTYPQAYTTDKKAQEFIDNCVTKKLNKLISSIYWHMRREPELKKRVRMWKKICRLKLLL